MYLVLDTFQIICFGSCEEKITSGLFKFCKSKKDCFTCSIYKFLSKTDRNKTIIYDDEKKLYSGKILILLYEKQTC